MRDPYQRSNLHSTNNLLAVPAGYTPLYTEYPTTEIGHGGVACGCSEGGRVLAVKESPGATPLCLSPPQVLTSANTPAPLCCIRVPSPVFNKGTVSVGEPSKHCTPAATGQGLTSINQVNKRGENLIVKGW